MRVIRISKNGGPEVLSCEEIAVPEPKADEIAFRVEVAGINFIDIYQRTGLYPVLLPATLGLEAAGVVTRVGSSVTRFRVGDRIASAKVAGAEDVVVSTKEIFSEVARRFTGGRGVDVVYDSVGKDTFEGSLASLRPRGMLVTFGNASGPIAPFSPLLLSQKGSLFLTRPTLGHYTATVEDLQMRADDLFRWYAAGELKVRIGATFPLAEAAAAHRALEGRGTTGKVLLIP